ncbi:hypothetical protein PybrP1_003323 [[Pythium] brassicae (nom. inval.)]|nr:hypothetical protein PybrP1_003323 [[Pythium] brassicae (nom. inval.)]
MTTTEAPPPPRFTLARPPLLTPESPAAASSSTTSSSDNNNSTTTDPSADGATNQSPLATTASGAAFFLSPRALSALEDFEKRSRDPGVLYGRDVIQVPLKLAASDEYVNLVLSHREFDRMAVHIPQYDEMAPRALVDEITRLLADEERAQKLKQRAGAGAAAADPGDSAAVFQARVMELEFERKRLTTKLAAARALQTSVSDENTTLRMTARELEAMTVQYEAERLQNELLQEQAVRAATRIARVRKRAADAQQRVRQAAAELQQLRAQVAAERAALDEAAARALAQVANAVQRREQLLEASYLEEKAARQQIAEKFFELSGRIRVFCRVRPPTTRGAEALLRPKPHSVLVARGGAKEFAFDHVFAPEATQRDVFAQVAPLVVSEGVIPRALQHVFAAVDARQFSYDDTLAVSMVEIYNDQILDLLSEDASRAGKGAAVKAESDITARAVTRWSHVDDVLAEGNANRNIAATSMNLESSRSHALVFLHLASQHRGQVQMGAVRPSVESGELFRLKDEARALETRLKASDEKLAEWKDECRYKSEQLTEARERAKDLERQLRFQSDEVASLHDAMERSDALALSLPGLSGSPPLSPSDGYHLRTAPPSPTQSVKSTRSTTSSATRRSLGSSMRQLPPASDPALDSETRRKSLSTLPTRSSPSALSARTIRASREAPPALPSRKPLASTASSSSSASASSVPPSPARVGCPSHAASSRGFTRLERWAVAGDDTESCGDDTVATRAPQTVVAIVEWNAGLRYGCRRSRGRRAQAFSVFHPCSPLVHLRKEVNART